MDSFDLACRNLTYALDAHDPEDANSHRTVARAYSNKADEAANLARGGRGASWNVVKDCNAKAKLHMQAANDLDAEEEFFNKHFAPKVKKINPEEFPHFGIPGFGGPKPRKKSFKERYANEEESFNNLYGKLTQYRDEHDRGKGDLAGFHEMYTDWLKDGVKHSALAVRCGDIASHLSSMVDKTKGPEEDNHEFWPSINIYKKLRAYHGTHRGKFDSSQLDEA